MIFDLVIANACAFLPSGKAEVDIGIKDGRITAIAERGVLPGAEKIDAARLIALPGAVDMHVHFRDPGATHKEDFAHGSAAAVCGGVTTICDMPNTKPPVISSRALAEKLEALRGSSYVDFGLWAGGSDIDEFSAMKELGAVGLKVFMNRAAPGSQSYTSDLSVLDNQTLLRVLNKAAYLDWPVCVHVQSPDIDEATAKASRAAGKNRANDVCAMTRSTASAEAQARLIQFAGVTGARVHIAHISYNSMRALDDLKAARRGGALVTAEVTPPCLTFKDLDNLGPLGIPFAHSEADNERYWEALREGLIDVVATDHAPHSLYEKMKSQDDAWEAPSGYPGVETMLPLLIDAVLNDRLTFERLVEVSSRNPAKICGFSRKGAIAVGNDADIVLIDPYQDWVIDQSKLHSKSGWSPYHGRRLKGRIRRVLMRGREISRGGTLLSHLPIGRQIILLEPRTGPS